MNHSAFLPQSAPFAKPTLAERCAIAAASSVISLGLLASVLGLFNTAATEPMVHSAIACAAPGSAPQAH